MKDRIMSSPRQGAFINFFQIIRVLVSDSHFAIEEISLFIRFFYINH